MLRVDFVIHGDIPGSGTKTTAYTEDSPLNLSKLKELLPYEGEYHFRLKTNPGNGSYYVWTDLLDDSIEFPAEPTESSIQVQALALATPTPIGRDEDEFNYSNYLIEMKQLYLSSAVRIEENQRDSANDSTESITGMKLKESRRNYHNNIPEGLNVESMTKTANSIWNKVKATASNFITGSSQLSDAAEQNLSDLADDLSHKFNDQDSKDINLLSSLWNSLFPGSPYERASGLWKNAGFQKIDPVEDLKNSGVLALKSMHYLCQNYFKDMQLIITKRQPNIKSNYPVAVVGVNLTLMLCDILNLRDHRCVQRQASVNC